LIFQADVNLLLNVVNGWVYIEVILKKQKNIQPKTTKNSSPKMKNREKKKKKKDDARNEKNEGGKRTIQIPRSDTMLMKIRR
jgi:hypothetical protein